MENNTTAGSAPYNVNNATAEAKCPFIAGQLGPKRQQFAGAGPVNRDWWPNAIKLNVLRQNSKLSDPTGENYNYAEEFKKVNLAELKNDLNKIMTTSQDWWPADYGTYAGLFIRLAWHSAGTYRIADGQTCVCSVICRPPIL